MQPKLFLMLAVVVLLAALLGGNPFLCKGGPGPSPAVPLKAAPAAPAGEAALPVGFAPARSGPSDWSEGRIPAAAIVDNGNAGPVGLIVNQLNGTAPKGTNQAKGAAVAPQCPDLLLRPLVVDVETDASGEPVWVLKDGRRLWRNPVAGNPGAGKEPLLVPAPPRKRT